LKQVPEGTSNIKINVPIAILAEEGEDLAEFAKMTIPTPLPAGTPTIDSASPSASVQSSDSQISPSQLNTRFAYYVPLLYYKLNLLIWAFFLISHVNQLSCFKRFLF